jgi:hypothetical protein
LKQLHPILSLYPQFGEPLQKLKLPGEVAYLAAFPPLCVEYIVDEPNRAVFIISP